MFQKIQLILLCLLFSGALLAQSPKNFNYQAALRDNADQVLANTAVTARFTIKQGSINGATVYQESQSLTTDDLGLLNASIGTGVVLAGSMNTIGWSQNTFYLKVEINTGGGYVDMGTAQLRSVPYAMHATSTEELTLPYADGVSSLETAFFISNDGLGSAAEFHSTEAPAVMVESNQTGVSSIVNKNTPGDGYGLYSYVTAETVGANAIGLYASGTGSIYSRGVLAFSDGAAFHGLGLGDGVGIMAVCETGNAAYLSTNSTNDYRPTLWLNESADDYARLRFSNYTNMDAWDVEAKYYNDGADAEFKISMAGNTKFIVAGSGYTGININDPASTLHVQGLQYGIAEFRLTNENTGSTLNDGFTVLLNDEYCTIMNKENGSMSFGTNNETLLTLYPDSNQHVSIGGNASLAVVEDFHGTANIQLTNQIAGLSNTDGLKLEVNDLTATIINRENASLILGANNQNNLFINANGKIGIGGFAANGGLEIRQTSTLSYNTGISFVEPGSADYWAHGYGTSDDYDFYWNGGFKAYIRDDNGAWTQGSDRSLKNTVVYMDGSVLTKLNQLKPCSYFYNNSAPGSPKSIGFIAQEVEQVFPDLVYEKDGIKTLAYTDFAVLSVAAIQEQQKQIEMLNSENQALKNQQLELNERLQIVEEMLAKMMKDEK